MKRLRVYGVSVVVLVLLAVLGQVFLGDRIRETYAELEWKLSRGEVNPVIYDVELARRFEEATGIRILWMDVKPQRGGAPIGSIGLYTDLEKGKLTSEQVTAVGNLLSAFGVGYDLESIVLWLWHDPPHNAWKVIYCVPAGCTNVTGSEMTAGLQESSWEKYMVAAGWVRE